ncbi:hypothetical protein EBS80_01200 [bacterium]|nr:hypothetical protein [bacterium]
MLRTEEPLRSLLATIDLSRRVVIEVGVGTGAITRMVLDRAPDSVIGYEIDSDICALRDPRLDLRIGDFRAAPFPTLDARHCLIAAPPYGLLPDLRPLVTGRDAPIVDAILMVRRKHLVEFPDFAVAFTLGAEDFEPPTEHGDHFVIRRGFPSRRA